MAGQSTKSKTSTETTEKKCPKKAGDMSSKKEELEGDMDELLEEIDAVLEENCEEFVKNYVQRGGE